MNKIIKECLVLIATLKKLKRFSQSHVRKQLVRSFVLTNLDYCNALLINTFCNARKNYCKKCNKKIAAPGLVCNKHGKIDDVLKLSWLPVDDRLCMNTAKPAYKRLHDQNFPYQLKLWCETITRNSSSLEFQENNIEFEKSTIFEGEFLLTYPMVFVQENHSQRSNTNQLSFSRIRQLSEQFVWIKGVRKYLLLKT